ncbi:MAG: glycoside hydrolase family 9 protein [Cyanobacteria bacterium P01_A01_bin.137]
MLESLLSFLLGWTNADQCGTRQSFIQIPGLVNTVSSKNIDQTSIPITHIYTVSENVVALRIETGELVRGKQVIYEAEPGDIVKKEGWVLRKGKFIGQLVPDTQSLIRLADQYVGPKLNTDCVDFLSHYQITTSDGTKITPSNIYRKSNIRTMAETGPWKFEWPRVHTLFLELPEALVIGETYRLSFKEKVLQDTSFIYKPEQTRSEAVQVSHLGFDPDDPAKVAFLSTWMGNGGGLDYPVDKPFWLIDTVTGKKVYEGKTILSQSKNYRDLQDRNHNDTNVFIMDFSDFSVPGQYRVYVDGIGTSYEFEIGENTWRDGFYVSARGMYHQRSGIALEQPYTDYQRPRPFHPDDGMVIYRSTVPLMDTHMGFDYRNGINAFEALVATRTDEEVPEAWGGWMDAGDWDRRISHLEVSRSFLELVELYPQYFDLINLNLPESNNNLPDILDEALWGLDMFRRLQTEEGGIPGGIESAEHPIKPQGSWQESQMVMVYGPGIWSSYVYANVAARAAYVLEDYDKTLAQTYKTSAIRAMRWANAELAKKADKSHPIVHKERNLAAAELYRLTGDNQWHQLFLDTTVFKDADVFLSAWNRQDQNHAAFVYSRTEQPTVNQTVKQNAINAIVRTANTHIENIERTGFKWNADPGRLIGWGTMTTPKTQTLFHAHTLTGDDTYLRSGILATQFAAGANPSNMMYTIGVGHRNPQMPLMSDVRASGQEPPPGITVYGPMDVQNPDGHVRKWERVIKKFASEVSPEPWQWPTSEAYFDEYYYVPVTEFTVHQSIGPTAYTWGYLAASDKNK